MWKKQDWVYLAQEPDKFHNTCICLKGLRETKNISQGSWHPSCDSNWEPTSTGFNRFWDRYLWSCLWFLFSASANSGLEPLPSTPCYNSLFISRTTIPSHWTKPPQGHGIALKNTPFQNCERSTEDRTNTGILPLAQIASRASISDALKILVYTLPKLDHLRRQKTRAEIWHLCVFS